MNMLKITSAAVLAVSTSATAQTTIYSCNFDSPPYSIGSIDAQQGWVTAQAAALSPGLTAIAISTSAGSLAPQAGNGCLFSENGPNATLSGRFAFQAGAGKPIVDAINAACAASATSIEFSCYMVPPTPTTEGTSLVGARHGMVLYVTDSTGVPTKAAVGFQCRAFDSQVYVVQWLDVGQLGVTAAGNYLINFTTPLTLTAGTWNAVACKWLRETGMPQVKINAGDWTDVYATSTINYVAKEFDIVNTRGSTAGGAINTVSTVAYMDTLVIAASQPAYPQCSTSAGDCVAVHPTGGCNIVSCCEAVCGFLPSCCDTGWDQTCVDIAIPQCGLFVYSCTSPNTPANNCAISPQVVTVTAIPAGFAFNTTAATTDGPSEPLCRSPSDDFPIHKDVWFRFMAPTDGKLTATNCFASSFDSKIAAYDIGTDPAAFDPQLLPDYFIGCNEDCADPVFTSELSVSGIVGGHYYLVRVGGYAGASGTGTLTLSVAPPPNPCDPANLIQGVAGHQIVTLDTTYANFTPGGLCSVFTGDVWNAKVIKFTSPGDGTITVQNCSDTAGSVDARIVAMTACGDASTVVACDDDGCTGAAPYASKLVFNAVAGQTYYFAVGGYDNTMVGPFNIEIVAPAPPPCPPDFNNDRVIDGADIGLLLSSWGFCGATCPCDLNEDGKVSGADLGLVLSGWGPCAE
jgi:hypothetical protein